MKNPFHFLGPTHQSSAKVVDGKLILSFPGALRPVVWQMDFAHVKASALEVQENEGIFALMLKTPKGENVEIAPFDTKEEAVAGLLAASKALEGAEGKIRHDSNISTDNASNNTAPTPQKKRGGWLAPILGILMLLVLLFVWSTMSPQAPTSLSNVEGISSNNNNAGAVGVPLSADDFLNAQ